MISFQAQRYYPIKIQKKYFWGDFLDSKGCIAKLDSTSQKDLTALNKLKYQWLGHFLINEFRDNFIKKIHNNDLHKNEDFFILTEQTEDFENLDEKQILGVMQINKTENKKEIKIKNLLVNPFTNFEADTRNYKQVGTQLIKFAKAYFAGSKILVNSERTAVPFYEKQGFKRTDNKTYNMKFE